MDERSMEVLREAAGGGATVVVRGSCMEPRIAAGSSLAVRARRFYLPGDVIVFRTPAGDLAVHRVLGWRPAGLVTKGDDCVIHDAPVARAAIIGAVATRVGLGERARALVELGRILARRLWR